MSRSEWHAKSRLVTLVQITTKERHLLRSKGVLWMSSPSFLQFFRIVPPIDKICVRSQVKAVLAEGASKLNSYYIVSPKAGLCHYLSQQVLLMHLLLK